MEYLDTDDLYGPSMMQLLSIAWFDWVDPKYFSLDNYSNYIPIACFLEVHLDYADELNDLHNDYLLAGEKIEVRLSVTNHRMILFFSW